MISARAFWMTACLLSATAAAGQGLVITPLPPDEVIRPADTAMRSDDSPVIGATQPVARATLVAPSVPDAETTRRSDLPRPSVIIGDMAVLAGFDPRGPLGMAFATREAIRQRDTALFERLIGRGAFDPEQDRLAEAIQTELQRSDCYRGGIDGVWGAGSAGALDRFSDQAKTGISGAPAVPVYRSIIRLPDTTCPAIAAAPVARQPAARNASAGVGTARSTATRTGGSRSSAPAAQPTRSQQPAARSESSSGIRRLTPSMVGTGLFR